MVFWWAIRCILASLIGGVALTSILALCYLRFSPSPPETPCDRIPKGTVVLVPAFSNLGKDPDTGKYIPGLANKRIAEKLEACADRFAFVLTQKAVSDALQDDTQLRNGTPVEQMHLDSSTYVGTLEALQCAVERVDAAYPITTPIALMAHDRHLARSYQALRAVIGDSPRPVMLIHLGPTPYQDDAWYRPWQWAASEVLKWPVQSIQILRSCRSGCRCSSDVNVPAELRRK